MSDINYSDWNMKLGNLILKPPGKATGCLLVTRLESAPGVTWGPGGPKCPAPYAGTLPPQHTLLFASSGKPGGWRGEAVEIGQKAPAGENEKKRKITSCWISDAPLFSRALSLCSHLCSKWLNASSWALSSSPPTFCLPHSPKPVVFSTLHRHRHPFHLSNYIHFQTDVLWQSYKALTSLFLINEILP